MKFKIYYVNLDRSPDRRKYIEDQLAKLPYEKERISAADGKKLSDDFMLNGVEQTRLKSHAELLTRNMIGCSLSHYNIYNKIIEDGVDYALVVEDDVEITKQFVDLIEPLLTKVKDDEAYLVYFHGDKKIFDKSTGIPVKGEYGLYQPVNIWQAFSTGGYLISKHMAARLAKYVYPIHTSPDSWGMFTRDGVISKVYALLPLTIRPAHFSSDIGYSSKSAIVRFVEKTNFLNIGKLIRFVKDKIRPQISYELTDEKVIYPYHKDYKATVPEDFESKYNEKK